MTPAKKQSTLASACPDFGPLAGHTARVLPFSIAAAQPIHGAEPAWIAAEELAAVRDVRTADVVAAVVIAVVAREQREQAMRPEWIPPKKLPVRTDAPQVPGAAAAAALGAAAGLVLPMSIVSNVCKNEKSGTPPAACRLNLYEASAARHDRTHKDASVRSTVMDRGCLTKLGWHLVIVPLSVHKMGGTTCRQVGHPRISSTTCLHYRDAHAFRCCTPNF